MEKVQDEEDKAGSSRDRKEANAEARAVMAQEDVIKTPRRHHRRELLPRGGRNALKPGVATTAVSLAILAKIASSRTSASEVDSKPESFKDLMKRDFNNHNV